MSGRISYPVEVAVDMHHTQLVVESSRMYMKLDCAFRVVDDSYGHAVPI